MHILKAHAEFCDYQVTFKNNSPRTIKWFEETIRHFLKYTSVCYVAELSEPLLRRYFMEGKIERNWTASHIKNKMSALGLFFKWCVKHKYLEFNPLENLPIPKLPSRIPAHITVEQASFIFEWLRYHRFRYRYEEKRALAIFAMFMYTGLRLTELLNLKVHQVDFDEKTIFIKNGKGGKDRILPLIGRLERILKEYLHVRHQINDRSFYFFVSIKRDTQMSYLVVKRLLRKISDKTKIHIHPHKLRHSFAVQMLEGGCDIYTLSKMLGHSDIKTTTIYLTATTRQKVKQAEKHPLY